MQAQIPRIVVFSSQCPDSVKTNHWVAILFEPSSLSFALNEGHDAAILRPAPVSPVQEGRWNETAVSQAPPYPTSEQGLAHSADGILAADRKDRRAL